MMDTTSATYWIIDGHCDSIGAYLNGRRSLYDDGAAADAGHWDLKRARLGRVGLQFFASYIEAEFKPYQGTRRGLELIAAAHAFAAQNKEKVFLVRDSDDLRALGGKKTGLLLTVEGGEILGEDLFMLDVCFELGVRSLGLTWNQRNAIGDGVGEDTSASRLSRFGVRVIERMNDLGMLVDVSHLNETGFWHILEVSRRPIIASHSCARHLCDHRRNLTDDQLRALGRAGGVAGVNFCPDFLANSGHADINQVVQHIVHIAKVAGVEAVGIGSDFDGVDRLPRGLEDVSKMPALFEALRCAGFNEQELTLIASGNFWRVLDQVLPRPGFRRQTISQGSLNDEKRNTVRPAPCSVEEI